MTKENEDYYRGVVRDMDRRQARFVRLMDFLLGVAIGWGVTLLVGAVLAALARG